MKQNILYLIISMILAGCLCVWKQTEQKGLSDIQISNIEALAEGDDQKLDCSYTPVPQKCSITVSADVATKIFGIVPVGSVSGSVTIPLEGAQECKGNGDLTCKPVRCDELIQSYIELISKLGK